MSEQIPQWWKESTAYQIYPRSFQDSNGDGIGDLRGIISRLDYLQYLGIDLLWLSPVYDSPNDDNGYDIRDYHRILNEYGTMDDMGDLIAAADARGIKIMMDLVANHTSDEHPWFEESRHSKDSLKRDWYIWKPGKDGGEPTNWESMFGGSAWEYDQRTGEYYLHCFSRKQPDLNWENREVRQALYEMMGQWMDRGISGFRVDASTFIKKNQDFPQLGMTEGRDYAPVLGASLNQPGLLDFLREMKSEVLSPRGVITVAEAPGVDANESDDFIHESSGVFSMLFAFEHVDVDIKGCQPARFNHWTMKQFKDILSRWQLESGSASWLGLFIENHDHVRSVSKFGDDKDYHKQSAKMLAAYYFLMRGTPFIYQGQEIGMTNSPFKDITEYRDIESINLYRNETLNGRDSKEIMDYLSKRSRDHSRTPMQWDAGESAGFTTGEPWIKLNSNYEAINMEQSKDDPESILQFYRKLIRLRKENKTLVYGSYAELYADSEQIGGYTRTLDSEKWTVLCNFTSEIVKLDTLNIGTLELSNRGNPEQGILKPYEALVYRGSSHE